jgi:RimJ/RimL family protein N-acetyltransferase
MTQPAIEPLLLALPTALTGTQASLHAYTDADAAGIRDCVLASREHLAPWMPWVKDWDDPLQGERYVRKMQAQWIKREDFVFIIRDRATGAFAGACGLHEPDWSVPKFMIGYWISPAFQGKGLVTEATRLLVRFGFEHLQAQRLSITCDAANVRSANVPQRAGFTQEAYICNERRNAAGVLSDTLLFGLTREDWLALRAAGSPEVL